MQEGNRAEAGISGRARAVLAQGGVQGAHEDAQDAAEQSWIALGCDRRGPISELVVLSY